MPCGGIMPPRSFADDLLPDLGVGGGIRRVQALERQAAGLRAIVVAGDAVLLDECLIGWAAAPLAGRWPRD